VSVQPAQPSSQKLLAPKQVAARLGIAKDTLFRWIARGKFPPPMRFNRRVGRWTEEEVQQWITSFRAAPKNGAVG
jgi:excisionase family DNA binding protein